MGQHALLRADEEVLLGRQVQVMIHYESVKDDLSKQLGGRQPSNEEWASALGIEVSELLRRLTRGHHRCRYVQFTSIITFQLTP